MVSTETGLIPPYPLGTSGTYLHRHPGDEGICKSLLDVAQERTAEKRAADETRATTDKKRTAAKSVAAAAAHQETVQHQEKQRQPRRQSQRQTREQQLSQEEQLEKEHPEKVGEPSGFNPVQRTPRPGSGVQQWRFLHHQPSKGQEVEKPLVPATLWGERGLGRYEDCGLIQNSHNMSRRREGDRQLPTVF
ncbi:hypothetical protein NDU88_000968 [Pleurodeles waltl]|uniref:Uncharacterized protein n=1 Tax=Pleurodeles waltl TaxID=8319 RepID=A0AAV7V862_PLEWA|nr:hypothetical protein NDU88_000968 [Pleurodeles waltl]